MTRSKKLLVGISTLLTALLFAVPAFAANAGASSSGSTGTGLIGLGAGIGIGLAAFGGGMGQGRASASALDGIARNPGASGKIFAPMILALALIETLVIYALIISIILTGKIA